MRDENILKLIFGLGVLAIFVIEILPPIRVTMLDYSAVYHEGFVAGQGDTTQMFGRMQSEIETLRAGRPPYEFFALMTFLTIFIPVMTWLYIRNKRLYMEKEHLTGGKKK